MHVWKTLSCAAVVVSGLAGASERAQAQSFPNRPITLVIPFAPGGSTSIVGRVIADKMGELLGEKVVVDNRPGANGVIAMRTAARAAPDGTTIVFANTSSTTINVALNPNAGYDTHKDFAYRTRRFWRRRVVSVVSLMMFSIA